MGPLIVVAVRMIVPLTIFRWPLWGGVAALAADACDILILQQFGFSGVDYQRIDKPLDVYYLAFEAIVAQRWAPLPRWTASALFAWRIAGFVLFEVTGARPLFLIFPNLFELFYLFVLAAMRWAPSYALTPRRIAPWLGVLLVPKLAQEYALHYARWLDDASALDIIKDVLHAVFR